MADGQVFSTASIEAAQNGDVQAVASLQCGVLIALDSLSDDGVDLTDHIPVPGLGFTSWQEEAVGDFLGVSSGMEHQAFGDHARIGQDISDFDNMRVHLDMRRGATDNAAQIGAVTLHGKGSEPVTGFEHIELRWQRSSSTLVDFAFIVRTNTEGSIQSGTIATGIAYGIGDDLRWIFVVKWPVITIYTAPVGTNAPKTLIGSFSLESDYRPNARIGFEGGAAGAGQKTIFGIGGTGELAVYDLGPEQNNQIQITASIEVHHPGIEEINASIEVSQNGEIQTVASIEVFFSGVTQTAASMQCAVLIALDDLDENGVNLSSHVPDFGFTSWEEEAAGDYVGQDNGMISTDVFKHTRSGQDLAVVDNYRVHCDMRRNSTDSIGEEGLLLLNGNGAKTLGLDEHFAVGWERVSTTTVQIVLFRRDASHQVLQGATFESSFAFGLGAELRFIFVLKWPVVECFTAPVGQNSPKTFVGSIALTGEVRDGARLGMEAGLSGVGATLFGGGVTGELALYQLGPEQNNVVQIAASMEVRQKPGEVQLSASMEVAFTGEVQVVASLEAAFIGEIQIAASIVVHQNGAIQAVASVEVEQHGQTQIVVSLATKVPSEVQFDASVQIDTFRFTEPFPPGRNDMLLTTRIRGRGRLRRR